MYSYLLVTPAKNEELFLPRLAFSISQQTILPVLWVIIDDGSTDGTYSVIKRLESQYFWVKGLRLDEKGNYCLSKYGVILNKGFKYAIERCNEMRIPYDYLGIIDADIQLDSKYYEKLLVEFNRLPSLGVTSGLVYEELTNSFSGKNEIRGASLLIRRACFEECNGISSAVSPDTVLLLKARNRGWHIMPIDSVKAVHKRKTFGKTSIRKAYTQRGFEFYYLNYHPVNTLLNALYLSVGVSLRKGFFLAVGYLIASLQRRKKSSDGEVRAYFWGSLQRLMARLGEKRDD